MSNRFEEAAKSIRSLYDENAELWIKLRNQSKLPEKKYLERLNVLLPPQSKVLDLGCGDGIIAEYFANKGHSIVGVDSSLNLCNAFEARVTNGKSIHTDLRNFEEFENHNLILLWHSLFHQTPEVQKQVLTKIAICAQTGCILAFTSGDRFGQSLGEFAGKPLYHASLDPDEYSAILTQNGMKIIQTCLDDVDCGNISVWIAVKQ